MKTKYPNTYSQFNPRWADRLLGFNTDPKYNFRNYACLLMDLTSIANLYGKAEDPISLDEKLKQINGYPDGSGEYVHGSLQRLWPEIYESWFDTPNPVTAEQFNQIKGALDRGQAVIFEIDYNPKTVDRDSHYVLVSDYNPNDINDFEVVDPLNPNGPDARVHSLKEFLAWFRPNAAISIRQYVIFEGPTAPTPVVVQPTAPVTPTPSVLPDNFGNMVKKSTQWDLVVPYLEIAKPPEDAMFEDAKRVIAGIKSRQTDLENKKNEAEKQAATVVQTVENQKAEIGRLKDDMIMLEKTHKSEIDALKQSIQNPENLKKQYEANMNLVKGDRDKLAKENDQLKIDMKIMETQLENAKSGKLDVSVPLTPEQKNLIVRLLEPLTKLFKLPYSK